MEQTHITIVTDGGRIKIPALKSGDEYTIRTAPYYRPNYPVPIASLLGERQTFTIASAATGSAVAAADLVYGYEKVVVRCENCQYIQAATNLSVQVGMDSDDTLCDLYELNSPQTKWAKGDLPSSAVTLLFVLDHPVGIRRIRFILSKAASGGSVVFTAQGMGRIGQSATWGATGQDWEDIFDNWEDML